ncbi:putative palmitoyl-protein thioesterase precursor [Melampsora larici-populina 98AG31]|uniref:Palmitoyl-protein thioesterase 1 n=1 Tax=Melampsora larici-populina (strain 98AG31 / pathotype 3-4-7) TaxID=747676 RepID=F4RAC0_MELLP|nr:putative palmitoyl-protein thioesterase precursor [Melampsora larici-populina 98AG31]EGG10454.1 putative palmitoyl-protein thioesterase precursor [Melampsora larici-populina 98AG31]
MVFCKASLIIILSHIIEISIATSKLNLNPKPASRILKLSSHSTPYITNTPVVIWHGLGDSYKNPEFDRLSESITERYPGTSVYLIHLAERPDEDQKATWFGSANAEVEYVCQELNTIDELVGGFDGIGFSQGGQLLRAYVERCNQPHVRNLITLGAQHMGVSEYPPCRGFFDVGCQIVKRLISTGSVYSSYAQEHILPAQYFRDQRDLGPYFEHNDFLRDINNELAGDHQPGENLTSRPALTQDPPELQRNQTYKKNMLMLENFVMIRFSEEQIVKPAASAHFGVSTRTEESIPLERLPIYKEDYIGLKELDESGRIAYGICDGSHMQIGEQCWNSVLDWIGTAHQGLVIQTQT